MGMGDASAKIIKALEDATESIKPCLPAPAMDNLWAVDAAYEWPKGGGHKIHLRATRNSETQTDATATQVCDCARAELEAAKVPDADGQADMPNGTSAYGVTYAWARPR